MRPAPDLDPQSVAGLINERFIRPAPAREGAPRKPRVECMHTATSMSRQRSTELYRRIQSCARSTTLSLSTTLTPYMQEMNGGRTIVRPNARTAPTLTRTPGPAVIHVRPAPPPPARLPLRPPPEAKSATQRAQLIGSGLHDAKAEHSSRVDANEVIRAAASSVAPPPARPSDSHGSLHKPSVESDRQQGSLVGGNVRSAAQYGSVLDESQCQSQQQQQQQQQQQRRQRQHTQGGGQEGESAPFGIAVHQRSVQRTLQHPSLPPNPAARSAWAEEGPPASSGSPAVPCTCMMPPAASAPTPAFTDGAVSGISREVPLTACAPAASAGGSTVMQHTASSVARGGAAATSAAAACRAPRPASASGASASASRQARAAAALAAGNSSSSVDQSHARPSHPPPRHPWFGWENRATRGEWLPSQQQQQRQQQQQQQRQQRQQQQQLAEGGGESVQRAEIEALRRRAESEGLRLRTGPSRLPPRRPIRPSSASATVPERRTSMQGGSAGGEGLMAGSAAAFLPGAPAPTPALASAALTTAAIQNRPSHRPAPHRAPPARPPPRRAPAPRRADDEGEEEEDEAPLNVGAYRRQAQRHLMLSHLRESSASFPGLQQIDWAHLDNQGLHAAVSAIVRVHAALQAAGSEMHAESVHVRQQLAALYAAAGKSGGAGLSEESLELIPTSVCTPCTLDALEERHKTCAICHEEFCVGESLRKLPCQHMYHAMCIGHWLRIKSSCPMCNAKVKPE